MTEPEYVEHLKGVYLLLSMMAVIPIAEMREAQDRAEALGPVLDPTLYREKADALRDDIEATKILQQASQAFAKMKAQREARS